MTENQVCPKCKGDGDLPGKIDVFDAVMSFGISALTDLSDRRCCKVCKGLGHVAKSKEPSP